MSLTQPCQVGKEVNSETRFSSAGPFPVEPTEVAASELVKWGMAVERSLTVAEKLVDTANSASP